MYILHYSLGLPPYRSGGLTKYATDLLLAQSKIKDTNVILLYPAQTLTSSTIDITFDKKWNNINIFKLQTTIPIPLLHGIKNPESYICTDNGLSEETINKFLNKIDVFHIHTLMGIPKGFIESLKSKGVKIVYTSHDYFGLCFKVNFINNYGGLCSTPNGINCYRCNIDSPSNIYLYLRNLKLLHKIKRYLPSKTDLSKKEANRKSVKLTDRFDKTKEQEYEKLRQYYFEIFHLIDDVHFNSELTKNIFCKFITFNKSKVIPISNSNISDNRKFKNFNKERLSISFIGNITDYKGFPQLKQCLINLFNNNKKEWTLNVWGKYVGEDQDCINIKYKGKYKSSYIENVFEQTDLLIVPSIWNETFSLITLEAISYGVPVLVSSTVGAKDIIEKYSPYFIFENEEELQEKINSILDNRDLLTEYNQRILNNDFPYSFTKHVNEIISFYKEI